MPSLWVSLARAPKRFRPLHHTLVAILAGATATASHSQWLQSGYDAAKTFGNSAETTLTRDNVKSLSYKWADATFPRFYSSPTVQSDGRVFACLSGEGLGAFSASTGTQLWTRPLNNPRGCNSPTLKDSVVYAITTSYSPNYVSRITAFAQVDGTELWQVNDPFRTRYEEYNAEPALSGDRMYVTTYRSGVAALDAATGRTVWMSGTTPQSRNLAPVVSDGKVFVATGGYIGILHSQYDGVHAFDAATGTKLWNYSIPQRGMMLPALALGKAVYIADQRGTIHALGADNGNLLWQRRLNRPLKVRLAANRSTLYAVTDQNVIYAISAQHGKTLWTRALGSESWAVGSDMVWANDMLFMATYGPRGRQLLVLDANSGDTLTEIPSYVSENYANVTVVDGRVLMSTGLSGLTVFGL